MTIQNSDTIGNYVTIVPIKTKFTDTEECIYLTISIIDDNLTNGCVFRYTLYTNSYISVYTGTVAMTGDNYTNWIGDNETPYVYVTSQLNLTIVEIEEGEEPGEQEVEEQPGHPYQPEEQEGEEPGEETEQP